MDENSAVTVVLCVAICCLTVLGSIALMKGIGSGLLTTICATIGGLVGFKAGKVAESKKRKK